MSQQQTRLNLNQKKSPRCSSPLGGPGPLQASVKNPHPLLPVTAPVLEKWKFSEWFTRCNHPQELNFKTWVFRPGMRFKDLPKWWSPGGTRRTPHEGIDFCCFITQQGALRCLPLGISVPAAFAGEVIKIFPDFLGWSILIRHEIFLRDAGLHSLYAHTIPHEKVKVGSTVLAGEPLASLAAPKGSGSVPLHLHLSILWIPYRLNGEVDVNWQNISNPQVATLCDPLAFLDIDLEYMKKP